jgi:hypothetical protein
MSRIARTRTIKIAGILGVAATVVALLLFQPWKLVVDDRTDEATPAGAVPLLADTANTAPTPPTESRGAPSTALEPSEATPDTVVAEPSEFVGLDHATRGNVLLLATPDGSRYVRFEGFETSNGPDLFVYLSTNPVDGSEGAFDDTFVNLGRLDGNIGNQNYEIPIDVDPADYASVVIWCDRFNSAFGAAPLR